MLDFKDFVPTVVKQKGILTSATYEPLADVLARARDFCSQPMVNMVNVETLLLPGLSEFQGSGAATFHVQAGTSTPFAQVIRVWFETE